MSHLRPPAARADRREGGRHGRPVARTAPSLPETHIRPQLLRLAVLPPTAVALGGVAAVLFTVRSTGARTGTALWAVLAGASSVALAGIVIAAVAAGRAARSVRERLDALRDATTRREAELHALVEALRHGDDPPRRKARGGPPDDADEFELLAADLARAHDGATAAVVQASRLSSQAGSEQKLEVFLNLARRLQSLVHREISILDELENEIEDPDLLKGLFHVDHLATRIRRHAENLAVLGGAVSRRQWSNPVSMTEVLRSAIAEVEQYSRVKLVPPIDGRLRGHAVADVIHLLAELVENATVFSAPHTQVLMRAGLVTSGLAVEVEDRGLGMPVGEQVRMNALLADPDQVNVAGLLADGRIGLFVVSQLARRHGITVRLQTNIYGGVQAVLVVPQSLLGTETATPPGGVETGPRERKPAHLPAQTSTPTSGQPYARVLPAPAGGPADRVAAGRSPHPSDPSDALRPSGGPGPADPMEPSDASGPAEPSGSSGPLVPSGPAEPLAPSGSFRAAGPADRSGAASGPADPAGTFGRSVDGPGRSTAGTSAPPTGHTAPAGLFGPADPADAGGLGPAPGSAVADGSGGGADPVRPGLPADGAAGGGAGPQDGTRAGDAPAPLPRRGDREERANPAEAVPGIRPGDRAAVAAHEGVPPAPRGVVRGTMDRPRLPRRRAQEHIVPQLRGGPAPRQDGEPAVDHDPGLMAAFQRGIGLAEAQQRRSPESPDPYHPGHPSPSGLSGATADADAAHDMPAPGSTVRHDGSASAG
ncbi:ATP-binding protein [Streptomyces sp. NPDC018610]|uniref:ATP-binding protein n=1 Tax=Streptomyces sp. NPDC018610 TaxID=3365049 RepID=UPI0037BA22A4